MIAALWGQLEQCAKQIMPWSIMSRGETAADHSLMLNYITSSMPGSLFRSLKRRHFLVSLGISGSLILRLLVIFSSGLFRLEYKYVTSTRELSLQDVISPAKTFADLNHGVSNNVAYWSLIKYGLPYNHGITPQFAVQSFKTSDDGKCCPEDSSYQYTS